MTPELKAIAHRSLSLAEPAFLKHYRGGRFRVIDGVAYTGSELPGPGFNFAAVLGPSPPLAAIVATGRAFFADAAQGWGVLVEGDAGHPVEDEMLAHGWPVGEDEPAFVMDPLRSDSSGLRPPLGVRPVRTEDDLRTFQRVCTAAYAAPPEMADLVMPSVAFATDSDMLWVLADLDGVTVGCGGYHVVGPTAVVGCLATLDEYRGRGVGAAVARHLLADAEARGCTSASLRSGPKSVPLYERLGFRYVCQHRTYSYPAGL